MSNNFPTTPTSARHVRRVWDIYDALPQPIRAALQEGPVLWSAGIIDARYRRWKRQFGDADAVAFAVSVIGMWHAQDIRAAQPWQPPGHGRRRPLPSPHIRARATMQTSGRRVAP
jgi:hypothetical protein